MSRYQQSSGATGGVVAPSRRDDRSGLLDIRALSSVIDAQRSGGPSASSVALPIFGTPWALQEVKAAPEPRATARPVVVGPDHRPLYVMIAALSVAVASLGAYVLMRPAPTVVVERTAAVVAGAADGEGEGEAEAEAAREAEAAAKAEAEAEAKVKAAALLAAAEVAPEPEAKTGAETAARARVPRGSKPITPAKPAAKPEAEPKAKEASSISVECVIDPSKCDTKGKTKPRVDEPGDEPSSTKGLPPAPTSSQIRDAMASVKPQAKACAGRHGGQSGEKVRIKLSVSGATGKVTAAQALDDHAGTPLGKCVADALGKAELPKFGKPQAGVVYAVTL